MEVLRLRHIDCCGLSAAQEKKELRVMETDYSHYAIVHEIQHSERQPSTALQLLSGYQEREWAPTAPHGGTWGRQGLGSPLHSRAPCLSTPRAATQGVHLGWIKPCTKDIPHGLWFDLKLPSPTSRLISPPAGGFLIPGGLCPFAASPGWLWGARCPPCTSMASPFPFPGAPSLPYGS